MYALSTPGDMESVWKAGVAVGGGGGGGGELNQQISRAELTAQTKERAIPPC